MKLDNGDKKIIAASIIAIGLIIAALIISNTDTEFSSCFQAAQTFEDEDEYAFYECVAVFRSYP